MARPIDLNGDMGESYGRWTLGADETIMLICCHGDTPGSEKIARAAPEKAGCRVKPLRDWLPAQ